MSEFYAISDIHGYFDEMMDVLSLFDLDSNKDNKLIFLGDYVNRGPKSCQVLYKIKELEEMYPKQVIVLIGNHDQMLIDWIYDDTALNLSDIDSKLVMIKSFFSESKWKSILQQLRSAEKSLLYMNRLLKSKLKQHHQELLNWLFSKKNTFYYETDKQIFVHAGICEVDEELWKHATEKSEFTWKFPAETGSFYKDIIAGHVSTVNVSEDKSN